MMLWEPIATCTLEASFKGGQGAESLSPLLTKADGIQREVLAF